MTHALFVLVALAVSQAKEGAATYGFEFHKKEDTATVEKEKDRTVFVITNKSGIGGVTVTRGKEPWPERVTVRLRYAQDNGLRMLESLELSTDRLLVEGDLKTSGRMRFCFRGPDGKQDVIQPGGAEPAGLIDVKVEVRKGGLELNLPVNMLRGTDKVRVTWIDAFRR